MRALFIAAFCCATSLAHAQTPIAPAQTPLARLDAPTGKFFDDPIALSPGGAVALLSTDAATTSTLHLWKPDAKTELKLDGLPAQVSSVAFVGEERVLVVYKRDEGDRVVGVVAAVQIIKGEKKLVLDKTRLGPADAIEVAGPSIATYSRKEGKGGAQHELQLFAPTTLKSTSHRSIAEDSTGLLRFHAGDLRPLWWSHGHTQLAAQKLGEYDKERDVRRPNRYIVINVPTDKVLVEEEIGDVLGFTKAVLVHRNASGSDVVVRLSDDRKQVLVVDGLEERALPLARPIVLYEPTSLQAIPLDDKTLLIGLQVDANNAVAVARRGQDPDVLDLYTLDRASMRDKEAVSRLILTLPGEGRSVGFVAAAGRVALLRKGKGFDRGGVAVELYALP